MDGGPAEPEQCRVDAAAQDVKHILYAGLPVGRQAPQVGAADHHRPGPQRDRLDDVTAAADTPVEHDLDLVAYRRDDARQHADRGWGAVQVVAAVVGHRDRRYPGVSRPFGVVDPGNSLDHERPAPLFTEPLHVV